LHTTAWLFFTLLVPSLSQLSTEGNGIKTKKGNGGVAMESRTTGHSASATAFAFGVEVALLNLRRLFARAGGSPEAFRLAFFRQPWPLDGGVWWTYGHTFGDVFLMVEDFVLPCPKARTGTARRKQSDAPPSGLQFLRGSVT